MAATILIVEDNETNLKLFREILQACGYETVQSTDGANVLEIASERKLALIVMDIQLPERSGIDLTRELKADEHLKHIPVVAVTAFAMKGDEERIRAGGCDDYIAKPISVPDFLATVARHLAAVATA